MSNPPLAPLLDHYDTQYRDVEGNQRVRCPVHEERSPSCTVNLGEGWFRCFHDESCKGDAYSLVMAVEGWDFVQAKQLVAELTGVDGPVKEQVEERRSTFRGGGGFKPPTRHRRFR